MTKKELQKLKAKLPIGGVKKLADMTGFSSQYIYYVLAGKKFNQSIIDAAILMAQDHQDQLQRTSNLIKEL